MADPQFFEANEIDLLLGATAYAEIILSDIAKGNVDEPIAQHTKLGWIVFGMACVDDTFGDVCNALSKQSSNDPNAGLASQLEKLCHIEHVETNKHSTLNDQAFENTVATDAHRNSNERELKSLHQHVEISPNVQQALSDNLEKMKPSKAPPPPIYSSHHSIINKTNSMTNSCTVFDVSAKTSNTKSLHNILYSGPTIRSNPFDRFTQWRRFGYAFSGDRENQYRQVKINPDHALFQNILACEPTTKQIEKHNLTAVTFGTISALCYAIHAIDEIGEKGELGKSGFNVVNIPRQWILNDPQILSNIEATIKNNWIRIHDQLCFSISQWWCKYVLNDVNFNGSIFKCKCMLQCNHQPPNQLSNAAQRGEYVDEWIYHQQ